MGAIDDLDLPDAHARAERGDSMGLYYYIHGLAERGQVDAAVDYAEQKHKQGRTDALAFLADAIYSSAGVRPDPPEWRRLLTIDANGASPESAESAFYLGIDCLDGDSASDAVAWLKRAGGLGFQEAWVALGFMYLEDVDPPDPVEAIRCFVRCREGAAYPYTVEYPEDVWPLAEDGSWRDADLLADMLALASPEQAVEITRILQGIARRLDGARAKEAPDD